MTKLKVFSLLPALLLASIVHAWEAPEIRNSLRPKFSQNTSLFNLTNPSLPNWIRRSESVH